MRYIASSTLALALLIATAKADGLYIGHDANSGLVILARHILRGIDIAKNCRFPYSVCNADQSEYKTFRSLREAKAYIAG